MQIRGNQRNINVATSASYHSVYLHVKRNTLSASWSDYGIGKEFIENVRGKVTEGTSALFLLVGQVTSDRVEEAFKAAPKFEVIASNLSHEQEEKLKEAFAH